ncbi:MAG: transcriptional regulator [Candidatus Bathyarchaeota archaeon]|nr:MAG: transcriptional regulator [Candidatus Bathyarchaeota archaeon]
MKRTEVLTATESILKEAGFQISERCVARPSCFDLVVRKKEQLALMKVYVNIGNVSTEDATELQAISECLSATPFFICAENRKKPLEDDTVYSRYNIYTITPKTLEDTALHGMRPLVEAGPGGYYVRLHGKRIRERRQRLGLSIGKLADMIGISRRTLYGYEKNMAKASVSVAYNLEWTLGVPLVESIDIFQSNSQNEGFLAAAKRIITRHRFLQKVLNKFAQINFEVSCMRRAPFDFIAQSLDEPLNIIGGVSDEKERNIDRRTEEIMSISKVMNAQPIFITDGQQIPNRNIPLIHHRDLEGVKHSKEFISKL